MKRKILPIFLILPLLFVLLCTCDETIIRKDCADRENISLVLKADYFTDCKPAEILPAHGTSFRIISGGDTIISGNLGANGSFETGPIDSTGCGLNNVVIEASYNGKSIREEFGLLCCDTTLTYHFKNISCNPPDIIKCESLTETFIKNITSSGDCISKDANFSELKNNSVIIASEKPLRIVLDQLLNLKGKISVESINPKPTGSDIIINGNQLEIYFDVDRSTLDTIQPVTINLPVFCLDESGKDQNSGTITIIVSATVCDSYTCNCPFANDVSAELFYANESVSVGDNKSFNFSLYTLSKGVMSDSCQLKIDRITRVDGSDAFARGTNSWVIENQTLPMLKTGDEFKVNANFAPTKTGEITEEFIVYASVYSVLDLVNKKNPTDCAFHFKLRGYGCEMNCPLVQVLGKNAKLIDKVDNSEKTIIIGTKIDPQDGNIIAQTINAKMTTDCLNKSKEPAIATYALSLPDGYYCSDLTISVDKNVLGTDDDRAQFNSLAVPTILNNDNKNALFTIAFTPPDLDQYYNTNHGNAYQCDFMLRFTDADGKEICHQEIQITAEVYEFSFTMGDVIPMQAFSQISTADNNPSYHVYDVNEYNTTLGNYGLRESLTPAFVNLTTTPNTPLSSHTLYFDVDTPDNPAVNFTHQPKLYLINTAGNNFSKISSNPVASYSTPNEFFNNYESGKLMDLIFANSSGDKVNFDYTPNRSKEDFSSMGGLTIHPNDVFIVWDPTSTPDSYTMNGNQKYISCGMALIYINSVKTGDDNLDPVTGGNGKASVSFYVVYPVKY